MHEPYTVVVIEDELIATEHICTIIRQKCPLFSVVATCEDGQSGLEAIRTFIPDLVITDIKMPVMNGLDLLITASQEFPGLASMVISGYQDFDYVKGALTSGSLDYLLKPVTPTHVQEVLQQIAVKIDTTRLEQRTALVKRLIKGPAPSSWQMKKYFPHESYYAAIVRENSLPRRFHRSYGLEIASSQDCMMVFYGRDEREQLYVSPSSRVSSPLKFRSIIADIARRRTEETPDPAGYTSCIVGKEPFAITQISSRMTSLYQSLDTQLTIGCSQILFDDDLNPRIENSTDHVDNDLFTKIEYFLTENKFEEFRCEIKHLVEGCKRKERTQLYVEGIIHRIYHYLITCAKNSPNTDMYEFMLDDAFFYASSYDELESNLFEIFQQIIKDDYGTFDRVDTPEFFTAVDAYIDANFAKALSLQGLCSTFGISQTYMSKMFRKYTGLSFSGYVKQVRVQKAKELLTTQRSLKIKDIAAMVGIRDQFYFSRLFHTVTGMTPSEFAAVTLPE